MMGRVRARRRVVVFARAPEHGRVKTRLAAGIGDDAALAIYRWLGERTLAAARAASNCEVEVRYTPAYDTHSVASWLGHDVTLRPQSDGDLGDRLRAAVAEALADGAQEVLLLGTDCPDVDAALIERAFEELDRSDVVLGPARDGGYYLLATRAAHPALFADIPWSSPTTLAATIGAAEDARLRIVLLGELSDIDTAADWSRWRGDTTTPSGPDDLKPYRTAG